MIEIVEVGDEVIHEDADEASPAWWTWVLGLAVATLLVATRARTLTEYDSVNLRLALEDFDVTRHQPHPPGYPLVVAAARAFSWVVDAIWSYQAVAVVAAVAAVVITGALAADLFGRRASWPAALALASMPMLLHYGRIVSVYLPEVALAPLAVLVARRAARGSIGAAALVLPVLAVAAGFRQTSFALLAPAAALALLLGRPPWRAVLAGAVAAAAITAAWLVPTVVESHGLDAYRDATDRLWRESAERTSLLSGAPPSAAARNAALAVAAFAALALTAALVAGAARLVGRAKGIPGGRAEWLVLLAWAAPYLLTNAVLHMGKPAYVLGVAPAVAVAAGAVAAGRPGVRGDRGRGAASVAAALAALAVVAGSLALPRAPGPRQVASFLPTVDVVRTTDREAEALPRLARSCPAGRCTIVSLPGAGRYYCHDPLSIARAYAPDSRMVRPNQVVGLGGEVLWIGGQPPEVVVRHAPLEATVGSWEVRRSDGRETAAILAAGLPDKHC